MRPHPFSPQRPGHGPHASADTGGRPYYFLSEGHAVALPITSSGHPPPRSGSRPANAQAPILDRFTRVGEALGARTRDAVQTAQRRLGAGDSVQSLLAQHFDRLDVGAMVPRHLAWQPGTLVWAHSEPNAPYQRLCSAAQAMGAADPQSYLRVATPPGLVAAHNLDLRPYIAANPALAHAVAGRVHLTNLTVLTFRDGFLHRRAEPPPKAIAEEVGRHRLAGHKTAMVRSALRGDIRCQLLWRRDPGGWGPDMGTRLEAMRQLAGQLGLAQAYANESAFTARDIYWASSPDPLLLHVLLAQHRNGKGASLVPSPPPRALDAPPPLPPRPETQTLVNQPLTDLIDLNDAGISRSSSASSLWLNPPQVAHRRPEG